MKGKLAAGGATEVLLAGVVSCLTFAGWGAAPLVIGPATYRQAYIHPRLSEDGLPGGLKGGRLEVVIENPSSAPVRASRILLNARALDDLLAEEQVCWWRLWPEEIPARGRSALVVQGAAPLLQESGTVSLTVDEASATLPLVTPVLAISGVTLSEDGRTLLVHLRNDDALCALRVQQVRLLGYEAEQELLAAEIRPLRSTVCRLRPSEPPPRLEMLCLQARAVTDKGEMVEAVGTLRAFRASFPIGTWVGPRADSQHLKNLAAIGIDSLINGGGPEDLAAMNDLSRRYGMALMSYTGWGEGQITEFVTSTTAQQPWSLALMTKDEPDLRERERTTGWRRSRFTAQGNEGVWRRAQSTPTFLNLCRPGTFFEYARIPDIIGYDAYNVGAPGDEASHWGYARDLEAAAWYMWTLHRNGEPSPTWAWGQGYHGWTHRIVFGLLTTGRPGRAMVTRSECRVQLVQQLGRGMKGLWWFICKDKAGTEEQFWSDLGEDVAPEWDLLKSMAAPGVDLSAYPALTKEVLAPIIAEAMRPWDEIWNEVRDLNSVVRQIRHLLQEGDPYQQQQFGVGWSYHPWDLATVASPEALVVFVTNLAYYQTTTGAVFRPAPEVKVIADLPAWLEPAEVFEVTPKGPKGAVWQVQGGKVEITAAPLEDVRIYVVAGNQAVRQACSEQVIIGG